VQICDYPEAVDVFSLGIIMFLLFRRDIRAVWDVEMFSNEYDLYNDKAGGSYHLNLEGFDADWGYLVRRCTDHNAASRPSFQKLGDVLRQLLRSC
jgi:hypothetical protein